MWGVAPESKKVTKLHVCMCQLDHQQRLEFLLNATTTTTTTTGTTPVWTRADIMTRHRVMVMVRVKVRVRVRAI